MNALAEKILSHLKALTGNRYPFSPESRLNHAERYIKEELISYGLNVEENSFNFNEQTFNNLVAEIPGSKPSIFIIGAHFDAVNNCPGADDNASGIAVLLESARLLALKKPACSIRFAAFNLEEFNMIGSSHYAKKIRKEKVPVIGMISLEMVGYTDSKRGSQKYPPGLEKHFPPAGDFIALVGNTRAKKILSVFHQAMLTVKGLPAQALTVPWNGRLLPESRLSDHSPFWDLGYPALLITDTSFYRNPHYHLPSDTLDTLNIEFMRQITDGVVQAIHSLPVS